MFLFCSHCPTPIQTVTPRRLQWMPMRIHGNQLQSESGSVKKPQNVSKNMYLSFKIAFSLQINGKYVIKSGTDFRELSKITLQFSEDKVDVDVQKIVIDSSIEEDPDTKVVVQKYTGKSCKIHKATCRRIIHPPVSSINMT